MNKVFRCDCGTHVLQISYNKDSDLWEDVCIEVYNIYNPETGRKFKNPTCIADVVITNNRFPKELEELLKFFKSITDKRPPKTIKLKKYIKKGQFEKTTEKAVDSVKAMYKEQVKKNKELLKNNKGK